VLDATGAAHDVVAAIEALAMPAALAGDWAGFVDLVRGLRTASAWPAEAERAIRWYEPHLARLYDDAGARAADLAQLCAIAGTYPTRERFLSELALDPPDATSAEAGPPLRDDDYLILSTIHSAKGQEWTLVQVLNVVDGCIPSDMATGTTEAIEEERRLLYVAMTRAKDELDLLVPQRFFVHPQSSLGDRHVYASRSRFLPSRLEGLFEICSWPAAGQVAAAGVPRALPPVDVAARLRSLWK
jgi:DNA helicase-2/ATP-dependent DNA helicase PcrA